MNLFLPFRFLGPLLFVCTLSPYALSQTLEGANDSEQLRCVVSRVYKLSEVGSLLQLDQGSKQEGETVVKPGETTFFLDTNRGVVMGDISNLAFNKVEKNIKRWGSEHGLTLYMTKDDTTNYVWIDGRSDISGRRRLSTAVLWVDPPYIYSGVCR